MYDPKTYQKAYRVKNPDYHKLWMRKHRSDPANRAAHNKRERDRRSDKRYAFKRLCHSYGLTVEDFARLLNAQDLKCATCPNLLLMDRFTHIDHDHQTGQVRGLLCDRCNLTLGHAKDSIDRLINLVAYLKRNER